jgi:hypothetical protein
MEVITIHPESKEQTKAFEVLAKAFNIPFKKIKKESPYDAAFVAKIRRGEKAAKVGKGLKVDIDHLWK